MSRYRGKELNIYYFDKSLVSKKNKKKKEQEDPNELELSKYYKNNWDDFIKKQRYLIQSVSIDMYQFLIFYKHQNKTAGIEYKEQLKNFIIKTYQEFLENYL